ncbi:MAG: ComEC/Rec2 family competence protein [Candidatus Dormibacteraeota bacterium]|nr:ComEC/Rec2 family competence protein [Candidatus Dormibacteraeota bacterium]
MSAAGPWRLALCAGAFSSCVALAPLDARLGIAMSIATCTVVWVALARWRVVTACLGVAACCVGTWRGASAFAVDHGPAAVAGHLGRGAVVLRGTVGDAGVPGRVDTIVVDVHQLATSAGTWSVSGAVVVEPLHAVDVLPGDTVDVTSADLRAPPRRPGALSAAVLERVGVTAIATAAQVTPTAPGGPTPARVAEQVRRVLTATVARALPEPEATLLLGVAFGIHSTLPGSVRSPLQDAGLIHIVAVSGLKVVMVAGLVNGLARQRRWSRRHRTAATLGVIILYVVLSGAGAAALRSGLMVGAGLLLSRDGRRPHSFALLGLCAACLLAVDPALATDVGFQLSFLGTAGILILGAPIAARLPGPRLLAEPFALTVAAQLATAPVTAATFGVLSLVAPFSNAMVLPLLPMVITVGGTGALLGSAAPALGWLPLQVGALLSGTILAVARGAASLPGAAIHLNLWPAQWTAVEMAAAGAGWLVWRRHTRPARRAGLLPAVAAALVAGSATAIAVSSLAHEPLRVTVLDVGNGAAVLLRPPGGGVALIDGGSDGPALLAALGRVLSPLDRHLDAVVLTATDRASSAAIAGLLGHYDVGALVVSQPLPPALETVASSLVGTGTRVVVAGATPWRFGATTVRCVPTGPAASAPCVVQLSDGRATALITANLAQTAQDELAGVRATELRSDLLVAPTSTAPSSALLAAVRPDLVAVPAKRNPPGLNALGLDVAVTGTDSDIEYDAVPDGGFAHPGG